MRIGIITLPLYTNYGGLLQAYALQTVLKEMGHKPVTFTQEPHLPANRLLLPLKWIKRGLFNCIGKKKSPIFLERVFRKTYPIVSQYTQPFIDQNINTRKVSSFRELKEQDFDALVVGSDQIWRPMYYPHIENAFLQFAEHWKVKKISYAASFGTDCWEYTPKQTLRCRSLIRMFDKVSVREVSGIQLCKEHLNQDAVCVLDPTLLLTAQDYMPLFLKQSVPQSPGNLLVYILDDSADKQKVIDLCKAKAYTPFRVNSKVDDLSSPLEERIQPAVEKWLRGFFDAEMVITDSFHACVFAILFNKPFLVYGNKGRGMGRFHSLLSQLGLEDRLILSPADAEKRMDLSIDWNAVNEKLNQLRAYSRDFLKECLETEEQ